MSRIPSLPHSALLGALLLSPFVASARGQARVEAPDLLTPHVGVQAPATHGVLRSQPVHVSLDLLRQARVGHIVRLKMFQDAVFEAKLEDLVVEPYLKDTFHWKGRLLDRQGSCFVLTVHENSFAGWIFPNDPKFQSLCIQGAPGMFVARELEDSKHQGSVVRATQTGGQLPASSACNDDPNRLDLLLVYDSTARSAAGGDANARAAIANAVAQANTCMSRSSISSRFYAKSIRYISYTSSGNQSTDLTRLRLTTDGQMDVVHSWRRTYSADLVAMVRGGGGGVAYCKGSFAVGFSVNGYSSLGSMVLAHELGHNLGCGHDPANNTPGNRCTNTTYGRGHNFLFDESGFPVYRRQYAYTVMSYSSNWGSCGFPWSCTKTRQPNFSSPVVFLTYQNKRFASGTTTRDNRRTILFFRQDIANNSIAIRSGFNRPVFTRQPANTSRALGYNGQNPIMSVAVNTYGNSATYQWRKNGAAISGQTRSTLSLSSISTSSAGRYDCVVTTCAGATTSRSATLTVLSRREMRRGPTYSGPNWGQVVVNVGDIDRDGYPDIGIGHPNANLGSANNGHVEVLSGRTHGRITFWRDNTQGALQQGYAMAGGDVNGDGWSDVFASAPGKNGNRGHVVWYSRREGRLRSIAAGTTAGQRMGTALDLAQLDNDTQKDLVVSGADTVYAYSSRNWTSSSWPQLWRVTPFPGIAVTRIATVGDVNFDGYDDIAIGMPGYASNRGIVQMRSGRDGALIWQRFGGASGNLYGAALAPAGDVTKNGIADLMIGEPGFAGGTGRVISMHGDRASAFRVLNGTSGSNFGRSLAFVGDYNRDGGPDFAIGRRGRVEIRRGDNYAVLWTRTGNPNFGTAIAGIDSNMDSVPDVAIAELGVAVWLRDAAPKATPPRFEAFGKTCNGSANRAPRLRGGLRDSRVGGNYEIVQYGMPASSAAILRLAVGKRNIPLDAIGMTGCAVLIESALVSVVQPTSKGEAKTQWSVPNETKFAGVKIHWQSIVLDQGANSLGLTASNGLEMTIGAR